MTMNKLSGTLRLSMSFALLLGLATHGMAGDAGLCAHEDAHDLQAVEADARLEADGKKLEYKARWTPLYLDDETGCPAEIGRASCRERVTYIVVAVEIRKELE